MARSLSPLRYPGGKSKIYDNVKALIKLNGFESRTYVEPFAGGFGIGIGLLHEGIIESVILNDYDRHIYNFWYSVLYDTDKLIELINDTKITLEERELQKSIYRNNNINPLFDGFATLFLNRVNFSGIIKGGPIGGLKQTSLYKVDCRFNKEEVIKKIKFIASMKKRIKLYNCDASWLITMSLKKMKKPLFINIDPPYVEKGSQLYTNYFTDKDHRALKSTIEKHLCDIPWIVTYDDCELIREIYCNYYMQSYGINHSAGESKRGKELVITNISQNNFNW